MTEKQMKNEDCFRSILSPHRLDIPVRYLFIKGCYYSDLYQDPAYYKILYQKYFYERTSGLEPDKSKKSLNEYVSSFEDLIESFSERGYDGDPIPISRKNKIPLDGAHRLTCCHYFDVYPKVKWVNKQGLKIDYNWFSNNNFSRGELNEIVRTYCELIDYNVVGFILWSPVASKWDDISQTISENFDIIMDKTFSLSKDNFPDIIRDIYSHDQGIIPSKTIDEKISCLLNHGSEFKLLLATDIGNNKPIWDKAHSIKYDIREDYKAISESTKHNYTIVHCTDNTTDSQNLINTLLSENNIRMASMRKGKNIRQEFHHWLMEYEKVLAQEEIDTEESCIVGSSVLELLGIRKSTDVDFILSENVRESKYPDKSLSLSENVDLASANYHKTNRSTEIITDDQIIFNPEYHFRYRGLKFADPLIIRDTKNVAKRNKDIKDVFLIDKHLLETDINDKKSYAWDIPNWKLRLLTFMPRYDLIVRRYMYHFKKGLEEWGAENIPKPVKSWLKRFIHYLSLALR